MGYLQEIGAWTQREVERRRETRPFAGALHEPGRVKVIAEIKRASPSEGPIAPNADATEVARRYEAGGAAAISVLTSGKDFAGSLLDLARVRQVTDLPLLCKDFFVDPYQVVEARAHGADAILVLLAAIICTAGSAPTKPKDKLDPPAADLPDIVAPRRRHVPERGVGAAL